MVNFRLCKFNLNFLKIIKDSEGSERDRTGKPRCKDEGASRAEGVGGNQGRKVSCTLSMAAWETCPHLTTFGGNYSSEREEFSTEE